MMIPLLTKKTASVYFICYTVLIFLSGFLFGNWLDIFSFHHNKPPGYFQPLQPHHAPLNHLTTALDLSAQQQQAVEPLLKRHHQQMLSVRRDIRHQLHQQKDQFIMEMNAILEPAQQQKFKDMRRHLNRRLSKHARQHPLDLCRDHDK